METVITSLVTLFLSLFAVMTLVTASLSAQDAMGTAWRQAMDRQNDQSRTLLQPVTADITDSGTVARLLVRNTGANSLSDMAQWDVIVTYYDAAIPAQYHIERLHFSPTDANFVAGDWLVAGIYQPDFETPEVFGIDILDTGETIDLWLKLSNAVGAHQSLRASVATSAGVNVQLDAMRLPPQLINNFGLTLPMGGSADITSDDLQAVDADDDPASLIYQVTTAPAHGTLSLGATFTQAEIDAGLLKYTNTGSVNDSFGFTITDGKDLIGPFVFTLTVSAAPTMTINNGLAILSGGMGVIDTALLSTADADDTDADLVYTVTVAPKQGILSLGESFTQADLAAGLLTYQHTAAGNDVFTFTISDGETTIGPYAFHITVPEE
ncbi:MAG: cadherin-like domain-containing protein [Anaerolineae bacterium]